jgi:putative flippase GtrA
MKRGTTELFLRFGVVGTIGFLIDAGVLYVVIHALGTGPYSGRLISYLAAASSTWALNRRFTFSGAETRPAIFQWLTFLCVNAGGGAINYGVYSIMVANLDSVAAMPTLGVAAGSIAGLVANFLMSRRYVFRQRPVE